MGTGSERGSVGGAVTPAGRAAWATGPLTSPRTSGTLPDFRGPMDPIGVQKSDSPRRGLGSFWGERTSGAASTHGADDEDGRFEPPTGVANYQFIDENQTGSQHPKRC